MPATTNQTFKITVPITKCYKRTTADGVEKYVIEGMASNTDLDLTGERMADTAIKSMATSLSTHPVVFKNEHGDEWDAEFGEVTALYATDEHRLMMEAELEPDHYRTKTLVKALEKGKSLGLSIGGFIPEGGAVKEWVSELGRMVKTYTDILLDEISVTGSPAVADTWLTNITKSVKDWKETPMPKNNPEVTKTEEQAPEVVGQTPVDAPAEGETPQAPDHEPTPKSEAEAPIAPADETPDTPTPPERPQAPEQKEEAPASVQPAPTPAEDATSEVSKSAIFSDFAQANAAEVSVRSLTETMTLEVWQAVYTYEEDERTPQERKAFVAQALSEYSQIVQSVADAFIDNGIDESAQKSFVVHQSEAIAKSLTDKDTQVEELTKSLSDTTAQLETAQKSLQEVQTKLETIEARKAVAFQSGAKSAALVDDQVNKSTTEPSIGELYLQKIGALPEAA